MSAPAAANSIAIARPMPLELPVTTAVWSCSELVLSAICIGQWFVTVLPLLSSYQQCGIIGSRLVATLGNLYDSIPQLRFYPLYQRALNHVEFVARHIANAAQVVSCGRSHRGRGVVAVAVVQR